MKYRFEAYQSHMRAAAFELCRQALVRFGIACRMQWRSA